MLARLSPVEGGVTTNPGSVCVVAVSVVSGALWSALADSA